MKIATRHFDLLDIDDDRSQLKEIARSFLEAYRVAQKHMTLPQVVAVERRYSNMGVQFILTFEPGALRIAADPTMAEETE